MPKGIDETLLLPKPVIASASEAIQNPGVGLDCRGPSDLAMTVQVAKQFRSTSV